MSLSKVLNATDFFELDFKSLCVKRGLVGNKGGIRGDVKGVSEYWQKNPLKDNSLPLLEPLLERCYEKI